MKKPLRLLTLVAAIIAIVCVGALTSPYWTHGSKIVTVTGVTTKRVSDHGRARDIYLVFTDDQTYKNVDSLAYLKFNSSDIQGRLIMTGRFRIDYYGFRVPVLSKYKNIIKAEKVQ